MVKYVKIVETTVGQRNKFEEKINQTAEVLNELGCTTITYFTETFGLSPMTQQIFIVYTREKGGYVTQAEFETAHKEYLKRKKGAEK